jgi:hypothetical protein
MQYNSTFAFDLIIGQVAEKALAKVLQEKRVEVKSDKLAHKTGRVFVEYESRGKKSGLATTQADYYCFEVRGVFILISTPTLKEICRKYIGTEHDIRGGDNNTSKGILLPILELINA